jgi:hypothetical protein
MHIHDFHSQLNSANEDGGLLNVLRSMSLIEDPKNLLDGVDGTDWLPWSSMGAAPRPADPGC